MKKLFLLLLLVIGLTSNSSADYLDDWPDDALCGWMENPSPPTYMVEEVKTRGISCSWGVVINNLPDLDSDLASVGESGVNVVVQALHFNYKAWLSNYGLKSEDLSPMLLELSKKTQISVPECTTDFCFTSQAEYAPNDEIQNKGELINAVLRDSPDRWGGSYGGGSSGQNGYINTGKGYFFEVRGGIKDNKWQVNELFPLVAVNRGDRSPYEGPVDYFTEDEFLSWRGIRSDAEFLDLLKSKRKKWQLTVNIEYGETEEIINTDQLIKSLLFWNPYLFGSDVGHRWNYDRRTDDECTRNVYDPKDYEEAGCIKDILVTSLPQECLEVDPPFYCDNDGAMPPLPVPPIVQPILIRPGWKILEGTDMLVIDETDPYWQTPEGLIEKPLKIDPGIEYAPETVPGADKKKVPDLPANHCAPTPGNPCPEGVIETSPMPDPAVPIDQANRPGWKIAEGSNFWSIDEADPYWQTEEGNQRAEARKYQASGLVPAKIDPGIEYAPETVPGADPKKVPDLPANHCGSPPCP